MPLNVKKKQRESVGAFLRRFSRVVQQSRVLLTARGVQYRSRPKTKRIRRGEALKRLSWRAEQERLRKLGKIE